MELDGMAGAAELSPNSGVEDSADLHFGGFRQIHEIEIRFHARVDVDAAHTSHAHCLKRRQITDNKCIFEQMYF